MSRREGLRRLLVEYHPEDAAELGYRGRMLDLAKAAADPFARDAFGPGHFTASAFVLHPERLALLLVHHRKLGRWLQPGGHIDPGDPGALAAARREAEEETGLVGLEPRGTGLFDLDVHRFPARPWGDPAHEHFDLRFLFRAAHGSAAAGPEVGEVRWMTRDEIREHDTGRSLLRPAAKALGDLS